MKTPKHFKDFTTAQLRKYIDGHHAARLYDNQFQSAVDEFNMREGGPATRARAIQNIYGKKNPRPRIGKKKPLRASSHCAEVDEKMSVCNTCGKTAGAPYRVYDVRGKVVQGCVDDFHTGHLVTPSESSFWHNRPAAKKIRAALKRGQSGKGYKTNPRPRIGKKKPLRASSATGRAPSKRLISRRKRNAKKGYFPNPRKPSYVVEVFPFAKGKWQFIERHATATAAMKRARQFSKNTAAKYGRTYAKYRVQKVT